jgi:hypothetical protein
LGDAKNLQAGEIFTSRKASAAVPTSPGDPSESARVGPDRRINLLRKSILLLFAFRAHLPRVRPEGDLKRYPPHGADTAGQLENGILPNLIIRFITYPDRYGMPLLYNLIYKMVIARRVLLDIARNASKWTW